MGKTEIRKSLDTGDLREAEQRARIERLKIDGEWAAHRRTLVPQRLTSLSEQEVWYLASKWFVGVEKRNAVSDDEWATLEQAEADLGNLSAPHNLGVAVRSEIDNLLSSEGIRLDVGSDTYKRLIALLSSAMLEAQRRDILRSYPNTPQRRDSRFNDLNAETILHPVANYSLQKLIDALKADPTRSPVRGKTMVKKEAHWQAIKEFFGADTDIGQIGRDRVREFMALLQIMPSNASKHFPGQTIVEAAEKRASKKLPIMAVDTANAYLRTLGGLFRFALREDLIAKNPTDGLLIHAEKKVRAKDKRDPFTLEELQAVFGAPLYTGCVDDGRGYSKPGTSIARRGRYWVPLVALFTGMRLNEICQLTLDDFVHQDGTDIILIGGDGDDETKRVKTEAGHRFVPVHPELRRLGLLEFVEGLRRGSNSNAHLFEELPVGVTGYRSDPFSKFFGQFLDHVGVTDRKKVFHSFRHNYRDGLREQPDISREAVGALGGWNTGRTEDDYGKGLRPSTLAKAIERVEFPGLDLSHLYPETA